jgi:hypothetical protein
MNRYLTRNYTAIGWEEAVRLSQLDRTPLEEIMRATQVELIHRTEVWAWWSDQELTSAMGLPHNLQPKGLSPDAAELMDEVLCSSSRPPQCGWALLATVDCLIKRERLAIGEGYGEFQPEIWERLTVLFCDGQKEFLYRFRFGSDRGYRCDVMTTLPSNWRDYFDVGGSRTLP